MLHGNELEREEGRQRVGTANSDSGGEQWVQRSPEIGLGEGAGGRGPRT